MKAAFEYRGRSDVVATGDGVTARLAANLARAPVSFDGEVCDPIRFREAVSALHDVVVGDLRFKRRDKTAYRAWKQAEAERLREIGKAAEQAVCERVAANPMLERDYKEAVREYWKVRLRYSDLLRRNDPALWRKLVPCDPVVTVGRDVVFLECFSADESAYGCLTVDRDGFRSQGDVVLGTTNVDYSQDLYEHFQTLRTYRRTRFLVDAQGVTSATDGAGAHREEKIDLPPTWLRGFLQVQAAMTMPMRRVRVPREALHAVLAWLRRHRERTGPRAIRFELVPGRETVLVLEPWGERIVCRGAVYEGPPGEPVRIWGRRRLTALARLLPLADGFDAHLLGTGFPSFWTARLGGMRFTLGLSGWTVNDWTRGSALDALAAPADAAPRAIAGAASFLREVDSAPFAEIDARIGMGPGAAAAALNRLAATGQVIFDLGAAVYRRRQVMPFALGEEQLGPPPEEQTAALLLVRNRRVKLARRDAAPGGATLLAGRVESYDCEVLLDADGRMRRATCGCSHHHRRGLRSGPCRHLLALRAHASTSAGAASDDPSLDAWYSRLRTWAGT